MLWDRQEGEDGHDLIEWLAVQDWCTGKVAMSGTSYLAAAQIPAYDRITVPAYVVASYSNTLHTVGTFRAWRRMASEQKWLRIHNGQEWPDYYDETNREDLRRFFDHFLKSIDNGWDQTPRVRYAVLDLEGGDLVDQPADQFPPAGVTATKYYLDGRSRTLRTETPQDETPVVYDAESYPGLVSFLVRFDTETEPVGYPKARLRVEAKGADDMDLFVFIHKLDAHGTPLQAFTVPNRSAMMHDLTERGVSILRYKGANGRLRVSMRHLSESATDDIPAHTFDRIERLEPGEIVDIEVDLSPVGLAFHPGEQLRLIISAHNQIGPMMPAIADVVPANQGRHIIHTGGPGASYLQLPVMR